MVKIELFYSEIVFQKLYLSDEYLLDYLSNADLANFHRVKLFTAPIFKMSNSIEKQRIIST